MPEMVTNSKMITKKIPAILITVFIAVAFLSSGVGLADAKPSKVYNSRQVLSLDGTWQIALSDATNVPATFSHTISVPGLVDMAQPAIFTNLGSKTKENGATFLKFYTAQDTFWYRRSFTIKGPVPEVAMLKVGKAMFGTRAFLNGQFLGEHKPCWTPGYFDAKAALKTGQNELMIGIGADREALGEAYPDGFDFEKERYIPGIFDSVELILTGTPHVVNVQVAPDITNQTAHVRLWLKGTAGGDVTIEIREAKSGKLAGKISLPLSTSPEQVVDEVVSISDCHLWSPETPFLYQLTVRTTGDEFTTRFGMREFRLDPATGRAMLNGKPYFMRGSNITLYRFFEDPERGDLPWDANWIRKLDRRIKDMHWNCLRYSIGFPPESWYKIADEEGILIQDEFPIWGLPKKTTPDELAVEYAEWMRERWNHPCVVIWDASNETNDKRMGLAMTQVRNLDMSGRPWDNSYNPPQELTDCLEGHPYHFLNPTNKLIYLATADPAEKADGKHAIILNEYGWLWLNRDGTPTLLTADLYKNLLGTNSTTAQRRHLYALYMAAETEFWRSYRKDAAVMQFTALSYSRTNGQTSDNWLEGGVAKLKWEPEFYKNVRDSFAPVGLMIHFWNDNASAGNTMQIPVTLINDLDATWSGPVTLRLKSGRHVLVEKKQDASIAALGTTNIIFDIVWPKRTGPCVLETELRGADDKPVRSVRELVIK